MLVGAADWAVWCWERMALYGSERVPSTGSSLYSPSLKVDDKEGIQRWHNLTGSVDESHYRKRRVCSDTRDIPRISLFHRAFQFTIYNGPTNELVCNKTLIQMSHTKTFKITPSCFDHQMIIIRELSDPG
jgi:hypothetical protein